MAIKQYESIDAFADIEKYIGHKLFMEKDLAHDKNQSEIYRLPNPKSFFTSHDGTLVDFKRFPIVWSILYKTQSNYKTLL